MVSEQVEIVILKPTSVFLKFLRQQLPGFSIPSLKELQKNRAAYVIKKQFDDESTLNEIERHFITIFQHEIEVACSKEALKQNVQGTFLDFLCCFKIDLHSQILVLEDDVMQGQHLIRIKPGSALLKWLRAHVDPKDDILLNLAALRDNATVIIKNFEQVEKEVDQFIMCHYQEIYAAEQARLAQLAEDWPNVASYRDFSQYFKVTSHNKLIHLHQK